MSLKRMVLVILALLVLAAAYWLASPLWRTERVHEDLPAIAASSDDQAQVLEESPSVLLSGSFSGFDQLHTGSGTASIVKLGDRTFLRFEEDFNVANGPDLYVGFGRDGAYIKGSEISRLKGNVGSQNYELPEGFDSSKYGEVWIWCKLFSVPFAKAELIVL